LKIIILLLASQDGLLSAWSTMTGIHLAAFHFNHPLVKLLVSQSGGTDHELNEFKFFFIFFQHAMQQFSKIHCVLLC
jgi:hypothetical protein